ncbi:MAG TPA: hypothetical protein VKM94_10560 [Blastocatellia bacterium]|nr:hypothetical protein [Blastocatellia bacterium]
MRRLAIFLAAVMLVCSTAQADTIHLKNGSVLKGKVTSFADDQFTVMIDTGSGRFLSRATVYVGDVARVEFDSTAAPGATDSSSAAPPTSTPAESAVAKSSESLGSKSSEPKITAPETKTVEPPPTKPESKRSNSKSKQKSKEPVQTAGVKEVASREVASKEPAAATPDVKETSREPETADTPPKETASPKDAAQKDSATASKEPEAAPSSSVDSDSEKSVRRSLGPVKTVSVDVIGKRDWTSSGVIVKRGDHIRITASGSVTLDQSSLKTSGPEGLPDVADAKKLMPDHATGALIGVIGADNDDFIFIGKGAEFTAARDGLLFLSVNEGTLADNTGSFRATIEIQSARKP